MRAVLDTNTVISGLLWQGAPRQLVDLAVAKAVTLYTSIVLLDELSEALARRKFTERMLRAGTTAERLVQRYGLLARRVVPRQIGRVVPNDPDDDHVLACALAAQADLIVSGDADLLGLKAYQGIPIVTAAGALTRLVKR